MCDNYFCFDNLGVLSLWKQIIKIYISIKDLNLEYLMMLHLKGFEEKVDGTKLKCVYNGLLNYEYIMNFLKNNLKVTIRNS